MKPTILCDIDCTLYSYREFVSTNFFYPKESMKALFGMADPVRSFPAVERTWKKFERDIEDRLNGLLEITAAHGEILFLSAFPDDDYKKQSFEKLSLKMVSSYPYKKIDLLKKRDNLDILLTIGDRPNDKNISLEYKSKLVYLPIYRPLQHLTASSYTTQLLKVVKESLAK